MATILVVDDSREMRRLLKVILERAGHTVLEADEGAQAIRIVGSQPVDLLLCDLYIPGKEGLETIRQLRRDFPDLPIIAMSGGSSSGCNDMLTLASGFGASRALSKPFSQQDVLWTVEKLLVHSEKAVCL